MHRLLPEPKGVNFRLEWPPQQLEIHYKFGKTKGKNGENFCIKLQIFEKNKVKVRNCKRLSVDLEKNFKPIYFLLDQKTKKQKKKPKQTKKAPKLILM